MRGRTLLASGLMQRAMQRAVRLPAPDGPYPVGTYELTLSVSPERKIGLKVWYPAHNLNPACFETYFSDEEMAQLCARQGPNHLAFLARVKTHAQPEAAFAGGLSGCPVVFFSHGHSLTNRTNSLVCESLASHGYVVCAIGHTGEGFCTLIDGRKIGMDMEIVSKMVAEARQTEKQHPDLNIRDHPAEYIRLLIEEGPVATERIKIWTSDLRRVADWVETNADPILAGRLCTGTYAAFGHSFGGAAALRVMLYDERFTCGVNMDGAQFGGDFFERVLDKPMLVMSGNIAGLRTGFHPDQRGVWWVNIPKAKHLNFTDGSLVYGFLPRLMGWNGTIDGRRMIRLMSAVLRGFFDRYLLHEDIDLQQVMKAFPELHAHYEPCQGD